MEQKYKLEREHLRNILAGDSADLSVFNAIQLAALEQANLNEKERLREALSLNAPSDKTLKIILKTALLQNKKAMSLMWRLSIAATLLAVSYSSFWYYTDVQNNKLLLAEASFVEDFYQIHNDYNSINVGENVYTEQSSFEELDELSDNINSIIND